jgi:predicted DNA binding CopG/RHH family protein
MRTKRLKQVNARLFAEDVAALKRIADTKLIPWQTELRLIVHRALTVAMVKPERDPPGGPR